MKPIFWEKIEAAQPRLQATVLRTVGTRRDLPSLVRVKAASGAKTHSA